MKVISFRHSVPKKGASAQVLPEYKGENAEEKCENAGMPGGFVILSDWTTGEPKFRARYYASQYAAHAY